MKHLLLDQPKTRYTRSIKLFTKSSSQKARPHIYIIELYNKHKNNTKNYVPYDNEQ